MSLKIAFKLMGSPWGLFVPTSVINYQLPSTHTYTFKPCHMGTLMFTWKKWDPRGPRVFLVKYRIGYTLVLFLELFGCQKLRAQWHFWSFLKKNFSQVLLFRWGLQYYTIHKPPPDGTIQTFFWGCINMHVVSIKD